MSGIYRIAVVTAAVLCSLNVRAENVTNANPMQIGLSSLFTFGGSSVGDETVQELEGGGHDPKRNGFTVQNVELTLGGAVDPYWNVQANIILQIDAAGETVVELEEAYATSRAFPAGLQLKAGQYFTEFGRQNMQHPHTWAFTDQPVIMTRLLGGDGVRGQGARLGWLMPTPWYSEIHLGMQNANGETAASFLSVPDEEVGGHTLVERSSRNFADLLYALRWLNGFDASDTVSVNLGVSALAGPNASGTDTRTRIYGADVYLKWQPVQNQRGFPFVAWQTEAMSRNYEAGDTTDTTRETLKDWGAYTQLLWGYAPRWVAGARFEYANGNGDNAADPLRDLRTRSALNLSFYPTEFSKLRVQYNRDHAQHLDEGVNSLWVQLEYNLGSHAAHTF